MKKEHIIQLGNGRTKTIHYYENGKISREHYYLNGEPHREDGPADIWYYGDGTIEREEYCLNGKKLTKKQFEDHLFKKKLELL